MEQLLSIKRIPIKIEVNVTNFEYKRKEEASAPASPSVKVSQGDSGVVMAAQPYKIDISSPRYDTYSAADMQGNGLTLTYDAVAKLPLSGDNPKTGEDAKFAAKGASRNIDTILNKLPKSKNNSISYSDGTLSINYKVEDTGASASSELLDLSNGFEFIPGSIEFVVSQMPGIEIEYLGDPIYFPRSADPNYKGEVDVIA